MVSVAITRASGHFRGMVGRDIVFVVGVFSSRICRQIERWRKHHTEKAPTYVSLSLALGVVSVAITRASSHFRGMVGKEIVFVAGACFSEE